MKEILQETIRVLKDKVNKNLEMIKDNQRVIKEILKEPYSNDRSLRLKERYDMNKTMLMENNDFINIQLTLINFIDKYKASAVMDGDRHSEKVVVGETLDLFEATVKGKVPFDKRHPMYSNNEFFDKLMGYYQSREEYEMCDRIMKTKMR